MRRPTINSWRRSVQIVSFVLLVYSGFILGRLALSGPKDAPPEPAASQSLQDNVLFTEGEPSLIGIYPPGAPCFFVKGKRLVKGCNIYLISDALAKQSPLSTVLPAILVFILLSFLLGRWWCGWVCPLGSLGDAIDALRRRLKFRHAKYSNNVKKGLRTSSYATFFLSAGISWMIGLKAFRGLQKYLYLPFCEVCPARLACPVLAGASPSFAGSFVTLPHCIFTLLMYGILAFFVFAFLTARRMWCHFCPIGLTTSWFNRGAALAIGKDDVRCNRCAACVEACPMGCDHIIDKSVKQKDLLNRHDCIFCLRCIEQCPKEKCLSLRFLGLPLLESRLRPLGRANGGQR